MISRFQRVYKKVIALAFFAAILSVAGLASYSYADNFTPVYNSNSPVLSWSSVKYTNSYIYAISSDASDRNSVYYSPDNGNSWYQYGPVASIGNGGGSDVSLIGITASDDGTHVYIATTDGIFVNNNYLFGGWNQYLPDTSFSSIAASNDGQIVIAGTNNGNIYYSENSGSSWNAQGVSSGAITSIDCSSDCGYAYATGGDAVYKGGLYNSMSWNVQGSMPNTNSNYSVAMSDDGNRVVVVGTGYIELSNNGGASWQTSYQPGYNNWSSVSVSPDGSRILATVQGSYPWSSADGGNTWFVESTLPVDSTVRGSSFDAYGNYVAIASSNTYLYTVRGIIPAPGTPDLADSSDTGDSNSDNQTNASHIDLTVSCSNEGDTVNLFANDNGTGVSSTCSGGNAIFTGYDISGYNTTTLSLRADETDNRSITSDRGPTLFVAIDRTQPHITSVSATNITANGADIVVTTDKPTSSAVIAVGGNSFVDYTNTDSHTISVSGLAPASFYYVDRVDTSDVFGNTSDTQTYAASFNTTAGPMSGCTDPSANNYNPSAITEDGSCTYNTYGCTSSSYAEYNPAANIDNGTCMTSIVSGCTDANAYNYNSSANSNDGSCVAKVFGCTSSAANNYNSSANTDDGSCDYNVSGCTDSSANNYNNAANVDNGSCTYNYGCTNSSATNYDSTAVRDNGTCTYPVPAIYFNGAVDGDWNNLGNWWGDLSFTQQATALPNSNSDVVLDASVGSNSGPQPIVNTLEQGNVSNTPYSINIPITVINGATFQNSSFINGGGAIDGNVDVYYPSPNPIGGTVTGGITYHGYNLGCTDTTANNFDSVANTDNGSCTYSGCTDSSANNYNAAASVDDGSCLYLPATVSAPSLNSSSDSGYSNSDKITNASTLVFTVTGCDGAASDYINLYANGQPINMPGSDICSGGTATITVPVPSGAITGDGTYDIYATQVGTGGESSPSPSIQVQVVTTAPQIIDPQVSSVFSNRASFVWNTDVSANSKVEYGLTTNYGSSAQDLNTYITDNHTVTITSLVPNTTYHYRIISADLAGNTSTSSDYTLETAPPMPSAPVLSPESDTGVTGDGITNQPSPYFTVNSCLNGANVELYINGGLDNSTMCLNGAMLVPSHDLSDGTYNISVDQVYDGGYSDRSSTFNMTINTSLPNQNSISVTDIATSTVNVVVNTDVNAKAVVNYGLNKSYGSSQTIGGTTYATSHTINLTGLTPSTTYHYFVTSEDEAGNVAENSADDLTFTTSASGSFSGGGSGGGGGNDGPPPPAPLPDVPGTPTLDPSSDTGTSSSDGVTSDTTPTISGSGTNPSALVNIYKNNVLVGTVTSNVGGDWTFTVPALEDGTYTFTVSQTISSRESAQSGELVITIDSSVVNTQAPAVSGGLPSVQVITTPTIAGGGSSSGLGDNGGGNGFFGTIWNTIKNIFTGTKDTSKTVATSTNATTNNNSATSGLLGQKQIFIGSTGTPYVFTKTLSLGSSGPSVSSGLNSSDQDVKKLQIFLNTTGFVISKTGLGSRGKETNTYGPATKNAVLKFQTAVGIKNPNGIFGPATRAKVNAILYTALAPKK